MTVTEQDLADLGRELREEFAEQLRALRDEQGVRAIEDGNRSGGVTLEEVKALLEELGVTGDALTAEDVRAMIPAPALVDGEAIKSEALEAVSQFLRDDGAEEPYDHEELRRKILELKVFINGLADRLGVPRLEG